VHGIRVDGEQPEHCIVGYADAGEQIHHVEQPEVVLSCLVVSTGRSETDRLVKTLNERLVAPVLRGDVRVRAIESPGCFDGRASRNVIESAPSSTRRMIVSTGSPACGPRVQEPDPPELRQDHSGRLGADRAKCGEALNELHGYVRAASDLVNMRTLMWSVRHAKSLSGGVRPRASYSAMRRGSISAVLSGSGCVAQWMSVSRRRRAPLRRVGSTRKSQTHIQATRTRENAL